MNKFLKTMVILGSVMTLNACAACPREDDYNRTPYGNRTSGSGVAIYDGRCARSQETMSTRQTRVQETRQPVRSADPVFNERIRK